MSLTRAELARRLALDIPEGAYVNLGIGLPTLVADHLPADREVILHSENGVLGMGPAAPAGQGDPDLINAGKVPVTEVAGTAYFHHADSFAMMRGGHLDLCVLGAFQVSSRGDLANWKTNSAEHIPGVGGAMDLASGARRVFVLMDLFTKEGAPRLVSECTYPLTAVGCVSRLYSDCAIFEFVGGEVRVLEVFGQGGIADLRTRLDVELVDARSTRGEL